MDIMPNASKKLQLASMEELKKLSLSIPEYVKTYGILIMQIHYNIFEGTPVEFFVPIGDNASNLIVVHHDCHPEPSGRQMIDIYWEVNKASDNEIAEYLATLPNMNWNKPLTVIGTHAIVMEKMKSILESPYLCNKLQAVDVIFDCDIYFHNEAPKSMTIPDGYKLGPLKPSHAAYIHYLHANPFDESDDFVGKQFTIFPTLGLYKAIGDSDFSEEEPLPVSWTSLRMDGLIGRTFTLPECRRQGFSTLIYMKFIKLMQEAGLKSKVGIERDNTSSIKMHQKLGFVKAERSRYVRATFSTGINISYVSNRM